MYVYMCTCVHVCFCTCVHAHLSQCSIRSVSSVFILFSALWTSVRHHTSHIHINQSTQIIYARILCRSCRSQSALSCCSAPSSSCATGATASKRCTTEDWDSDTAPTAKGSRRGDSAGRSSNPERPVLCYAIGLCHPNGR